MIQEQSAEFECDSERGGRGPLLLGIEAQEQRASFTRIDSIGANTSHTRAAEKVNDQTRKEEALGHLSELEQLKYNTEYITSMLRRGTWTSRDTQLRDTLTNLKLKAQCLSAKSLENAPTSGASSQVLGRDEF